MTGVGPISLFEVQNSMLAISCPMLCLSCRMSDVPHLPAGMTGVGPISLFEVQTSIFDISCFE
jgi:hypothetical protein